MRYNGTGVWNDYERHVSIGLVSIVSILKLRIDGVAVKPGLWTLDWTGPEIQGPFPTVSHVHASTWTVYDDQFSIEYSVWSHRP